VSLQHPGGTAAAVPTRLLQPRKCYPAISYTHAAGGRTARAATANMPPSLAVRREGERVPELPLAPLLNETPKRSLRGRCATRMAALGGAKRRPASAGDAA